MKLFQKMRNWFYKRKSIVYIVGWAIVTGDHKKAMSIESFKKFTSDPAIVQLFESKEKAALAIMDYNNLCENHKYTDLEIVLASKRIETYIQFHTDEY